jgi:predicted ABC-type ATPase
MPKYIFKANDNVLSHCRCENEPASSPGQASCPWCGCGWMISCSKCRKSFVYAEVRHTDTRLEIRARNDLKRFWKTETPNPSEIDAWVSYMTESLKEFEIGTTVVYFDGHYFPINAGSVAFIGDYALHNLTILPHAEALTSPSRLVETLGDPNYWIDRKRPEIIIVAGPNGAGKTTFANAFLPLERERFVYVNADEIARELYDPLINTSILNIQAGREMLDRIEATVAASIDLMFETTLATRTYAQKIPRWRENGYLIKLFYLQLPGAEQSIERVKRRVALGGHDIPADIIRRRFTKSKEYLENQYKQVVDEWYVWDSLEGGFEQIASWID